MCLSKHTTQLLRSDRGLVVRQVVGLIVVEIVGPVVGLVGADDAGDDGLDDADDDGGEEGGEQRAELHATPKEADADVGCDNQDDRVDEQVEDAEGQHRDRQGQYLQDRLYNHVGKREDETEDREGDPSAFPANRGDAGDEKDADRRGDNRCDPSDDTLHGGGSFRSLPQFQQLFRVPFEVFALGYPTFQELQKPIRNQQSQRTIPE